MNQSHLYFSHSYFWLGGEREGGEGGPWLRDYVRVEIRLSSKTPIKMTRRRAPRLISADHTWDSLPGQERGARSNCAFIALIGCKGAQQLPLLELNFFFFFFCVNSRNGWSWRKTLKCIYPRRGCARKGPKGNADKSGELCSFRENREKKQKTAPQISLLVRICAFVTGEKTSKGCDAT